MAVITKKTKCPLCGARNEAGSRRCQICTRPLTSDPLVTTAIYEEALWSRPVANAHRRAEIRPGVVAVLVILAALATNYVWLGYGPDWAHLPRVVEKGSDWKSYRSNPAYRADFPGDPIIGFVSRGRGVTVHNLQCDKAMQLDPARKVPVTWDIKSKVERNVQLRILTEDRPGILATISQAFTGAGANILNANCRARKDQHAINTFTVAVRDAGQLRTIMKDIEALAGVHSVERLQV